MEFPCNELRKITYCSLSLPPSLPHLDEGVLGEDDDSPMFGIGIAS